MCHIRIHRIERYIKRSRLFRAKATTNMEGSLLLPRYRDNVIKFLLAVDNFPRDYFPRDAPQAAPWNSSHTFFHRNFVRLCSALLSMLCAKVICIRIIRRSFSISYISIQVELLPDKNTRIARIYTLDCKFYNDVQVRLQSICVSYKFSNK